MKDLAKPGDYVVCLGAGNITQWAYALPGELEGAGKYRVDSSQVTLTVNADDLP